MAAAGMLAFATYWTIRLAFADFLFRQNTLDSVTRALRWDPINATDYTWQAELQEFAGEDPRASLNKAVRLNPYASVAWMRLAALSESRGDFTAAERLFQVAAQVDRMFTTRWALMNFYFRRDDAGQFWLWTRRSLEMSYGDLAPLFDLCWRFTDNEELIRQAVPEDRRILSKYLSFLMARNQLRAGGPVAMRLIRHASREDVPVLLNYCDRLLQDSQTLAALDVWNGVCERGFMPYKPLLPDRYPALTNAEFTAPPTQSGFDWRFSSNQEITILQPIPGGGVRISLSGKQPEVQDLLWQVVALLPDHRYRLRFEYRTTNMSNTGIRWAAQGESGGDLGLGRGSVLSPQEDWQHDEFTFSSGKRDTARLVLRYEREPGTMRAEGTLCLRNLALEFAP